MKFRLFGLLLASFGFSLSAFAQAIPLSGTNLSGTISVTNTFQLVQGPTNNRNGCTIQNNASTASGDIMWIYTGKGVSSCSDSRVTKGNSSTLSPGQPWNCAIASDFVLGDVVCIAGTATDPYYANFQ